MVEGVGGVPTSAPDRRRMILVVDTGVDDALALALAVSHPGVQLEAAVTSFGNVALDLVNGNTLRVLDWLGASAVPVVAGPAGPLAGPAVDATYWHGLDGLGGARLPASARTPAGDGVRYLIDALGRAPGELTLVCTGPLTALAQAVQREPRLVEWVHAIVVMGGAAQLPGNTTAVAEYNIYADPEAAAVVFEQDWPLTMVGLDVTRQVVLGADEVRLLVDQTTAEAQLVREVTWDLFERKRLDSMALHDPLAVGVALDPSLVRTMSGPVQVETRGEYTRGQTIFDLRPRVPRPVSRTRVCLQVDAPRFREMFFSALGLPLAGA